MIEAGGYQEFIVRAIRGGNKGYGRIRGGENNWPMVLLRPHGRSGGRVIRTAPTTNNDIYWYLEDAHNHWHPTRAQAAQAAAIE